MTRLLVAAALAAAALLPVTADATECTPKGCSGACTINPHFTGPEDLFRCYN
ncbi:MAG TPA: hypothetical protein VGX28_10775 [Frankiaceae bacterium]|jgi:hypothetical protein|nr:hypothetical protein [Frankiaceae bacterium]